jgi:hypothetical protein
MMVRGAVRKVYREDILRHAYALARANAGADRRRASTLPDRAETRG